VLRFLEKFLLPFNVFEAERLLWRRVLNQFCVLFLNWVENNSWSRSGQNLSWRRPRSLEKRRFRIDTWFLRLFLNETSNLGKYIFHLRLLLRGNFHLIAYGHFRPLFAQIWLKHSRTRRSSFLYPEIRARCTHFLSWSVKSLRREVWLVRNYVFLNWSFH